MPSRKKDREGTKHSHYYTFANLWLDGPNSLRDASPFGSILSFGIILTPNSNKQKTSEMHMDFEPRVESMRSQKEPPHPCKDESGTRLNHP
ncbi:hypothetical protein TNCV_4466861 [Trichonephila clavipes]|nr:hypothetical protein TNCV_4466861 [Trichonephila clavipes]